MLLTNLLILFTGIVLIYIAYKNTARQCPPARIEYRFVPRTFNEEQENPVKPSEIFADMFNKVTPFVSGFGVGREVNRTNINQDFISQS